MTLALPRTLDKARAKEREQLARKAGCQYHTEVVTAAYLDGNFRAGRGLKPVVRWGDDPENCWSGPLYKEGEKSRALYHAEIAADTYRRHFLMHNGERYEIKRRQERETAQAEKRRKIDARKALTADRVALYDALDTLSAAVASYFDNHTSPAGGAALKALVEASQSADSLLAKHREAAESIRSGEAL